MEEIGAAGRRLIRLLPGLMMVLGAVWLMTGLFAPLTLGLLLAALLAPAADHLAERTGCPRQLAAVLVMAAFYLGLGALAAAAAVWTAGQGAAALRSLPLLWETTLRPGLESAAAQLAGLAGRYAPLLAPAVEAGAAALEHALPGLVSGISARAAGAAARLITRLPALLLGSVFTVILSFCIAADYPALRRLANRLPPGAAGLLRESRDFGGRVLGRMLRVTGILSLLMLAEMTLGLWLLGIPRPWNAACAITLLDLLPLIGSGMILLPWGLWELLRGRAALGIGLWLLFGAAELIRTILEPRLMGARTGLPPLALTAALFVGLRLGGAMGAVLTPAGVLFLWDLYTREKLPAFLRTGSEPAGESPS